MRLLLVSLFLSASSLGQHLKTKTKSFENFVPSAFVGDPTSFQPSNPPFDVIPRKPQQEVIPNSSFLYKATPTKLSPKIFPKKSINQLQPSKTQPDIIHKSAPNFNILKSQLRNNLKFLDLQQKRQTNKKSNGPQIIKAKLQVPIGSKRSGFINRNNIQSRNARNIDPISSLDFYFPKQPRSASNSRSEGRNAVLKAINIEVPHVQDRLRTVRETSYENNQRRSNVLNNINREVPHLQNRLENPRQASVYEKNNKVQWFPRGRVIKAPLSNRILYMMEPPNLLEEVYNPKDYYKPHKAPVNLLDPLLLSGSHRTVKKHPTPPPKYFPRRKNGKLPFNNEISHTNNQQKLSRNPIKSSNYFKEKQSNEIDQFLLIGMHPNVQRLPLLANVSLK